MSETPSTARSVLFLSHATPEDNDFTRWLASQLTLAGYRVWFDLQYLKGGDIFWNKVEAAIRNEAVRMIAIVSKASYTKDGVRNEWDLATTIEKATPGFVIPVRLDELDFSLLPITIHRKNVIDFHAGWHLGLRALLDTVTDARIPRVLNANAALARAWLPSLSENTITWTDHHETLDSNWLSIISLPTALETLEICSSQRQILVTPENDSLPWFELGDHIVSFAPRPAVIGMFKTTVPLRSLSSIDTESFIRDGIKQGNQSVAAFEARNRVSFLISQAWDNAMKRANLLRYELANKRFAWYVQEGFATKNKVQFTESNGKLRRKQLVGRSEKLQVNWHYGVSMHPVLSDPRRLELRAHIVFTGPDGKPLESQKRMHKLRRSFCKSWWNDRWRGFMRAFLALISEGNDIIALPVGGGRFIKIDAAAITVTAPLGLSDNTDLIEDEDISLEEVDSELDDLDGDDALENEDEDMA